MPCTALAIAPGADDEGAVTVPLEDPTKLDSVASDIREDFDENQSVSVSVDVLVTEPRLKTVLRDVPILRQSAGVDNHEAWEPQPATRVISSSATFVFDGAGSGNADPHDTDGDRVLVGFVGNDLNRPVVLGQLDHRHTGHRPDAADGYRWRRWVAGSLIGVTTDGQVVLDASGVADGVLVKGAGGSAVLVGAGQKLTAGGGGPEEPVILGQTFLADLQTWQTAFTAFLATLNTATTIANVVAAATALQAPQAAFAASVAAAVAARAPYLSQRTETE